MLVLWLGTFALAASPQLHRLLHQDAPGPNHQCLITQLQQQPLLAGVAVVSAPAMALGPMLSVAPAVCQFSPVRDCRLAPSRAPPRA